jgi:protocatechuate 3,4-dioxygenase beta subunit
MLKEPPVVGDYFTSFTPQQRATSDSDGRFAFTLSSKEVNAQSQLQLMAAADGFGPDSAKLPAGSNSVDLTLRLVKDLPIQGRVLDTEGRPLAGLQVRASGAFAPTEQNLDQYLDSWKQHWRAALGLDTKGIDARLNGTAATATTDKAGRFRISGLGSERIALVRIKGAGIAQATLYVVLRAGVDTKPINDAAADRNRRDGGLNASPLLYGPSLDYVASPGRSIEGFVRESGSSKLVAGTHLMIGAGVDNVIGGISDSQGRYQLTGLPVNKEYFIQASPPTDGPWLPRSIRIPPPEGFQPMKSDIELARGAVLTGQVIDNSAGKGVQSGLRFAPLPGNKFVGRKSGFDSYASYSSTTQSDADGRFRVVVIPGAGILMATAYGSNENRDGPSVRPYKLARFDPADRERVPLKFDFFAGWFYFVGVDNIVEPLDGVNAVKVLDVPEKGGATICNLSVERGNTLSLSIQDSDGKPLTGALIVGLNEPGWDTVRLKEARCTIYGLDPSRPRQVVLFQPDRKLAGKIIVRGDEKDEPQVRLFPVGTVTGRVVDMDGQALVGAEVGFSYQYNAARVLARYIETRSKPVQTDKDGRFRLEGVIPDSSFLLELSKGRTRLIGEPRMGHKQVASGKLLDLGDLRVRPSQR